MKDFLALNMDAGERQAFASIGRCIYCGASGVELTDEHIVPFSLVGNTVLFKKAVCEPCRLVTHPYEERVLQHMYGNLRIQMDTPSRRRRKRPSTLDHTFLLLDDMGGIIGRRTVTRPWNLSPVACPSWESPSPGYLQGSEKSVAITGRQWTYLGPGTSQFVESVRAELGHQGPVAYRVGDVRARDYLRFIAKVTHAYAVALFGFDAFEHWLAPLIRCEDDAVSYLVGGCPKAGPIDPEGSAFKIDFGHPTDGLEVLLARVGLFEFLGAPEHLVVVGGAPAKELPRRLPLDRHGRPQ